MNESKIFTDTNINIPIQGGYDNIKITTPEDLYIAEAILKRNEEQ